MQQQQEQSQSAEHWATDVLGDVITWGNLDLFKKFWQLFIKLCAASVLVFFRFRTGTRFISGATVFWGYLLMSLCWSLETMQRSNSFLSMGQASSGKSSMGLFWIAMLAFAIVGLYRRYESRKNLRRYDGEGKPRYSADCGLSHLWLPFKRIVEPLGIIARPDEPGYWRQMDEYNFQKYVEPALIVGGGLLLLTMGYAGFGYYLIIGGLSSFIMVQQLEDNYFRMKQNTWDATVLSTIVQQKDEPVQRLEGAVIQKAIIRSDKGFEKWQESVRERPYFERSDNPLKKYSA